MPPRAVTNKVARAAAIGNSMSRMN